MLVVTQYQSFNIPSKAELSSSIDNSNGDDPMPIVRFKFRIYERATEAIPGLDDSRDTRLRVRGGITGVEVSLA